MGWKLSKTIIFMIVGLPVSFPLRSCHIKTRAGVLPLSSRLHISRIRTKLVASGSVDPFWLAHHSYFPPIEIGTCVFVFDIAGMCVGSNSLQQRPQMRYEFRR